MNPIVNATRVGSAKTGKYFLSDFCINYLPCSENGGGAYHPRISFSDMFCSEILFAYCLDFCCPSVNKRCLYCIPFAGALCILK